MTENEDGTVDLTLETVIAPEQRRFVLGSGDLREVLFRVRECLRDFRINPPGVPRRGLVRFTP